MDVAEYLIARGNEYLAVGNTTEADKCFKCAQTASGSPLKLPSLSWSGIDVEKIVQEFRLEQYLPAHKLHAPKNKLECVSVLASGNEYQTGEYDQFVSRLIGSVRKSRNNAIAASALPLKLVVAPSFTGDIKQLQAFFASVELVRLAIPAEFDFYRTSKPADDETLNLQFGYKAGPNWTFFDTMRQSRAYNTTLLLECDCFFGPDWLHRILQFVDASNGFWVAGALYGGLTYVPLQNITLQHLNGGVALYATGNKNFQAFLEFSQKVFFAYVAKKLELPYDCFLASLLADFYNADKVNRHLWQFVRSQYTSTSLLHNYSPPHDKRVNEQRLLTLTNYAVLHKKKTPTAATPTFIHLARCGGTYFYRTHFLPNLQRQHLQSLHEGWALPFELSDHTGRVLATVIAAIRGYDYSRAAQDPVSITVEQFKEELQQNRVFSVLGFKLEEAALHNHELQSLMHLCRDPVDSILLLRDPLRQAESAFYWKRDIDSSDEAQKQLQGLTFEDYLNSELFVGNWLVRKLTNATALETLTEQHFEQAAQFVSRCAVVGFQHQYKDFLSKISERYGFIYSPMFYEQDTQSFKRNTVSKKLPVTDSLVQLFVSKSKWDDRLYNSCLSKFSG